MSDTPRDPRHDPANPVPEEEGDPNYRPDDRPTPSGPTPVHPPQPHPEPQPE